jgi:hypothetical protein
MLLVVVVVVVLLLLLLCSAVWCCLPAGAVSPRLVWPMRKPIDTLSQLKTI